MRNLYEAMQRMPLIKNRFPESISSAIPDISAGIF
jgi:hypothetical protein